jgi:hypothetical protein
MEIKGGWNPSRPLNFASVCRMLYCLGLDPMTEDPTMNINLKFNKHSSSSHEIDGDNNNTNNSQNDGEENAMVEEEEDMMMGLTSPFIPKSPYLYPARSLCRMLEIWELCFQKGLFEFTQEDLLYFISCLMVISVDIVALGTPGLLYHRDRLLTVALRCFAVSASSSSSSSDGGGGNYDTLLEHLKKLLSHAQDDEVKMLLLRNIPVANTNGVGKRLMSELAMHISKLSFPSVESAHSDMTLVGGGGGENTSKRERYSLEAFMFVQGFFSKYNSDATIRRIYAEEGVVRLHCLFSMVDLLLMAAAPHYEYSVDECNETMVKVHPHKCICIYMCFVF